MTLEQFNSAVIKYCTSCKGEDLNERFVATTGGKNILYTKTTCVDGEKDWELASQLGITIGIEGYLFAKVEDIPSKFEHEEWDIPTCIKEPEGEISPTRVKQVSFLYNPEGVILYNTSFIAYSIPKPFRNHEIGFLTKQEDDTWDGFGESQRQEFIQWLIRTKVIPV